MFSVMALWHKRLRLYVLFFFGLAIGASILSLGSQTPIFKVWLLLPLMKMFRAPFRILFLHALSLSFLCAIGLDYFLERFRSLERPDRKLLALVSIGAAMIFSLLLLFIWPATGDDLSPVMKVVAAASRWPIYLSAFALMVSILTIIPKADRLNYWLIGFGCIGLITLDLFNVNHNLFFLPEKNPQIYEKHNHIVAKIKALTDKDHSRVFIASDMCDYSYCIKLGQLRKLSLINDYENMNPTRYNRFCNYMFGKTDRQAIEFFWGWFNLDDKLVTPELLNYMSAKYIWLSRKYIERNTESAEENYRMLAEFCRPVFEDEDNIVFLNPRALSRAYIVGGSRVVPDDEEALKLLGSTEFSPEDEVILSEGMSQPEHTDSKPASRRSDAIIDLLEPEEIRISTKLDGDGFLVLTNQYYPGWEATVDGTPARILRANYLFCSVPLTAGEHKVVFRYRPKSVRLGIAFTSIGLLLLVGSFMPILSYRRKGRSKNTSLPEAA
jgi:hypothetical protein